MDVPGFSASYRSARVRGKVVLGLLALIGLISMVTAMHDASGFDLIEQAEAGALTTAEANDYDARTQALAIVYIGVFIATGIAFLAWLSRSVDNVPHLTGRVPDVTPRWAIGWWFVPFANFVRPYQIVRDLDRDMAVDDRDKTRWLVVIWWTAWLATGLAGVILLRIPQPESLEALSRWFSINLVFDATDVIAAVLAILVVRQIQAGADRRTASPWPAGEEPGEHLATSSTTPLATGDDS